MADLRYRTSCDSCLASKVKCSQTKPSCWRCSQQTQPCVYSQFRKIGRPPKRQASELAQHHGPSRSEESCRQKQACQQQRPRPTTATSTTSPTTAARTTTTTTIEPSTDNPTNTVSRTVPATPAPISHSSLPSSHDLDPVTLGDVSWDLVDVQFPAEAQSVQDVPDPFETMVDFGLFGYATPATVREEQGDIFASLPYPLQPLPTDDSSKAEDATRPTSRPDRNVFHQAAGYFAGFALCKQPGVPTPSRTAVSGHALHHTFSNASLAHSDDAADAQRKQNPPSRRMSHRSLEKRASLGEWSSSSSQPSHSGSWKAPKQNSVGYKWQCHASLTEQLSRLGDFKSEECSLPFDMLLGLAEHIRLERDKVLSCPSCLGKTRVCQTLLLITMVLENLLSLFERACDARPSPSSSAYTPDSTQPSIGHVELDPRRDDSSFGGTVLALSSFSPPLMIGDLELDESFRVTFARHLLRRHLEAQAATAWELEVLLAEGIKDLGYKVAAEILRDVYRRIEYFKGFMAFWEGE